MFPYYAPWHDHVEEKAKKRKKVSPSCGPLDG